MADAECKSISREPMSNESLLPLLPWARALISEREQPTLLAMSSLSYPWEAMESMMYAQSIPTIKHNCVVNFNTNMFGYMDTIESMNTYGERVRARRQELGLSQSELAKLIGAKHQSTIGNIENRNGSSRHTLELSKALRVRYEWLETGEGEKELPEAKDTILLKEATLQDILTEVERRGAGDSARLLAELVLKGRET
ncbi:helix-turn-helix domain-containing protein [Chromobacterium haemolyticum]|nr:helix-turn-helix domain-containing protein [Chromobacterium haemolyticum]